MTKKVVNLYRSVMHYVCIYIYIYIYIEKDKECALQIIIIINSLLMQQ